MKLFDQNHPAALCIDSGENRCVWLAAQDFLNDLAAVSGRRNHRLLPLSDAAADRVVIGTLGGDAIRTLLEKADVDISDIEGRWEHFIIQVRDGILYLIGSDERGTMWAIYEASRIFLEVDPLYLWTDHPPRRKTSFFVDEVFRIVDGPKTARFRGWFINDEDLIEGYCRGGVPEEDYDFHRDYASILAMIVESALRLRQNLLIPCSHLDMDDPAHEALVDLVTKRGMFISMHHQEPVGVNQQRLDRWYADRGDTTQNINYVDHPEKYTKIWRHFIRKWAKYPNVIWQLGLRGRGDRPVWYQNDRVPDTIKERGHLISDALQTQWNIIAEETGRTNFLSSTTLWMEGMPLYRAGALKFPKGTMVILSDFGPDQMWGDEYYETPRLPDTEYGVYYHVCFWGCGPHLVQGNRPEKIVYNYRQAVKLGDTAYSVLNVSNIREHVGGIYDVAEVTWNLDTVKTDTLMKTWCEKAYHLPDGAGVSALYQAYYDSFAHLDDSRICGRMLLMDGMCKRVALMLMKVIAGEELHKVDIQNMRLFNFDDTATFIDFYRQATQAGAERFATVLGKAYEMLLQIPMERQAFFKNNLILHTETMLGLYRWVDALADAADDRRNRRDDVRFAQAIKSAIQALEHIVEVRSAMTSEKWTHWWDGDTLINLSWCIERTKALLDKNVASGDMLGARF